MICQSCKSCVHQGHFACAAHYRQGIMDTALPIMPIMITTVTLSLVIHCCHLVPATLVQAAYPLSFSPAPSWALCVVCYWTCVDVIISWCFGLNFCVHYKQVWVPIFSSNCLLLGVEYLFTSPFLTSLKPLVYLPRESRLRNAQGMVGWSTTF